MNECLHGHIQQENLLRFRCDPCHNKDNIILYYYAERTR